MRQPLPLLQPEAISIGTHFSMVSKKGVTTYYCNYKTPFDRHRTDDKRAKYIRIAKFFLLGAATQKDLAKAYGISVSTVHRIVKSYQDNGEEGFYEPRRTRGRVVLDAETRMKAIKILAQGHSFSAVAKALGIPESTFDENRRAGAISA